MTEHEYSSAILARAHQYGWGALITSLAHTYTGRYAGKIGHSRCIQMFANDHGWPTVFRQFAEALRKDGYGI